MEADIDTTADIIKRQDAEIARLRVERDGWIKSHANRLTEVEQACAELVRLRRDKKALVEALQAVLDGDYPNPRMHRPGRCSHGTYYYDACENCIDEFLGAALRSVAETKPACQADLSP